MILASDFVLTEELENAILLILPSSHELNQRCVRIFPCLQGFGLCGFSSLGPKARFISPLSQGASWTSLRIPCVEIVANTERRSMAKVLADVTKYPAKHAQLIQGPFFCDPRESVCLTVTSNETVRENFNLSLSLIIYMSVQIQLRSNYFESESTYSAYWIKGQRKLN